MFIILIWNEELKIEINDKMKYRLIEEIKKKRIQLTVNDEINILVDSFYEDKDLNIKININDFKDKIQIIDLLDLIDKKLDSVIDFSNEKQIKINYVEIAGELMRTPILQKMIENKNLKICKTILIDECTSVGDDIYNNFLLNVIFLLKN